jgi:hypothetical protein
MRRRQFVIGSSLIVFWSAVVVVGQLSPFQPGGPSPVYQTHKSYTDYYNEQLGATYRPQASVRNYTIDRYFYHRPTLSPYLNLTRIRGANSLNNYYRYVLPEVERRNQASGLPPLAPSPLPPEQYTPPANPGHVPLSNPYFNQFYNFGGTAMGKMAPPTPLPKLYAE